MATLLLMRHAKSDWGDSSLADHERSLNARGRKAAPRMGLLLREQGLVPELIVTSTARRAVETTNAVVESLGYEGRVEMTRRLYLAEPAAYLDVLGELSPHYGRVLLVGHNPGISELVALLTGVSVDMPTAAVARIELATAGLHTVDTTTRGRLEDLFRPRELD